MNAKSKPTLTSIPEYNESEADLASTKWVPKKKHEVLKAKYKCLKKLFQIYDASIIGYVPEAYGQGDGLEVEEKEVSPRKTRKKKRSHRARTDACAGTADMSSEPSDQAERETLRNLKIECSNTLVARSVSQSNSNTTVKSRLKEKPQLSIASSKGCISTLSVQECGYTQTNNIPFQHPVPYLGRERRKPTRFQNFIQRLLGIRREHPNRGYALNGHVLAASDNNINQRYMEKRRRRGLRFRRLRRPKKVQSDGALRGTTPALLDYAQAVQRNCLMDTTARQCPIAGCRMLFYGIINYNDHLNMCHFTERRFTCHYCHEGFERECDKLQHENEHIGLSRLVPLISAPVSQRSKNATTSDTQTDPQLTKDVQDEKLKKIMSFFDKISDSDQILADMKQNNRFSEMIIKPCQPDGSDNSQTVSSSDGESKRSSSCTDTRECRSSIKLSSRSPGVKCRLCGENFDYRRQLSLHVDLEHRVHDKFSKFHSCAGITNARSLHNAPGCITVTTTESSLTSPSTLTQDIPQGSTRSSNFAYSTASFSNSVTSVMERFKSGFNYKWEPGNKIIRV